MFSLCSVHYPWTHFVQLQVRTLADRRQYVSSCAPLCHILCPPQGLCCPARPGFVSTLSSSCCCINLIAHTTSLSLLSMQKLWSYHAKRSKSKRDEAQSGTGIQSAGGIAAIARRSSTELQTGQGKFREGKPERSQFTLAHCLWILQS